MPGFFLILFKFTDMKRWSIFILMMLFALTACKKDAVDASSTKAFQSSINDMASELSTLEQVKFNEALYILKTFGVEEGNDVQKIESLGKLLNGMKVPQILALADQVAKENNIDWTSTGPPSLGEMNIFGDAEAMAFDPNDVKASSLNLTTFETMKDSVLGPKAIQVVPRLVDSNGKPIEFSGAGLETVMEVFSEGTRILTSKNLMQDNDFAGFTIRMAALPADKVLGERVDITVTVKTSTKNHRMSKVGVPLNRKAMLMPQVEAPVEDSLLGVDPLLEGPAEIEAGESIRPTAGDPKTTVTRFLNLLNSQNLRAAYEVSENPSWGSFESFSNNTSGFGAVRSVNVKSISTVNTSANASSVGATYDVTDKSGRTTSLQVVFGLKNVAGEWKISSYKIN